MCGEFSDLAGSEQEHAAVFEPAEDTTGQVNRDIADADLAAGNAGLGTCGLGGLEALFKQAVEYGAGALRGLCAGIGVLHLSEDLGLADHLRVERGGDLEGVLQGIETGVAEGVLLEECGLNVVALTESPADCVDDRGVLGKSVDFHAVAGAQHQALAHLVQLLEFSLQCFGLRGADRKAFTHRQRGAMVGASQDK